MMCSNTTGILFRSYKSQRWHYKSPSHHRHYLCETSYSQQPLTVNKQSDGRESVCNTQGTHFLRLYVCAPCWNFADETSEKLKYSLVSLKKRQRQKLQLRSAEVLVEFVFEVWALKGVELSEEKTWMQSKHWHVGGDRSYIINEEPSVIKVKNLKGKSGAMYFLLYFIVYFYRDSAQLKVIAPEFASS